jgi:TrmH family RNA methyltransferase
MLSKNDFKYIQSLKLKKQRETEGRFVLEGPRLVMELLAAPMFHPATIYATSAFTTGLSNIPNAIQVVEISNNELERLSFLQTPHQCLAVATIPPALASQPQTGKWQLLLDGIQDPGNLGTIIRVADWFGVHPIFASEHTADCFNPKVVQASMGSILRVAVHYAPVMNWLNNPELAVYGADMHGESIWNQNQFRPGLLVIGNEGNGINAELRQRIDTFISIPKTGAAESLNAGLAAGILLSHLLKPS